ncbi:DoxX family protein [Campylobacter pinnipediorum]|uniref:DoxX family protein n=1 Tax=Campylobacter pinnipediorum TaxID=1965231 RepID=UPI001C5B578E|nr:DoxX family membrane protein [Campylobacter pinnipediorum]
MNKIKLILGQGLRFLLAVFMIYAGCGHFSNPDFYIPFVPSFLPYKDFFILLSGVFEVLFGVMLLLKPAISKYSALGIFFMMIVFLPIHINDFLVDNPAIGSYKAALIRLPFQFLFIGWAFFMYKFLKTRQNINIKEK